MKQYLKDIYAGALNFKPTLSLFIYSSSAVTTPVRENNNYYLNRPNANTFPLLLPPPPHSNAKKTVRNNRYFLCYAVFNSNLAIMLAISRLSIKKLY